MKRMGRRREWKKEEQEKGEGKKREWEEERECRGSGFEEEDDGKTEKEEGRDGERKKEVRTYRGNMGGCKKKRRKKGRV